MIMARCATCGRVHDLQHIEPSFRRPDAFFEVEAEARARRISDSDNACLITSPDGRELRCFVRTVLYVPIRGEAKPIGWGLWAEVEAPTYHRIGDLWDDPDQGAEPPLACTLANALPNYPSTLGLPGALQLRSPTLRPALTLSPSGHPFAVEANAGVPFERALEWRAWAVHS